jgi:hypothetical protein
MFKILKNAYDNNDLQKVSEILTNLGKGIFVTWSGEIDEKKKLQMTIIHLCNKRNELEQVLMDFQESDT